MSERAQVTSIEALESFRASLIVYLSKARPALEEVCDEVRRTQVWLDQDRRSHWQNEVRRRSRGLEQAQQELSSAKLSSLREPTAAQQRAVTQAQRALRVAEDKLRRLRKWSREFENLTAPLTRQLDQLHTLLAADMPRAVAYLAQVVSTLEAYAGMTPSMAPSSPDPLGSANEANDKVDALETRRPAPPDSDEPKVSQDAPL